jgi:hypothetical protein
MLISGATGCAPSASHWKEYMILKLPAITLSGAKQTTTAVAAAIVHNRLFLIEFPR